MQAYGSQRIDAALLMLPIVGFLPATDKRIKATVAEIEKHLIVDSLVLRYETASGVDGLPQGEGAFLPCSFWLVDNYVLMGRHRRRGETVRTAAEMPQRCRLAVGRIRSPCRTHAG